MTSVDGQILVAKIQRELCVGLPFYMGDEAVISAIVRTIKERENERSSLLQLLYEVERQLEGKRDWKEVEDKVNETKSWLKRWREVLHKPNTGGEGREQSERTSPPPCSM